MLKNVNVILLCLMMSGLMVACGGGESSSSGVAEDMAKRSYEFSFVSLPECRVDYTKKLSMLLKVLAEQIALEQKLMVARQPFQV